MSITSIDGRRHIDFTNDHCFYLPTSIRSGVSDNSCHRITPAGTRLLSRPNGTLIPSISHSRFCVSSDGLRFTIRRGKLLGSKLGKSVSSVQKPTKLPSVQLWGTVIGRLMKGLDILLNERRVAQVHAFSITEEETHRLSWREVVVSRRGRSTGPPPADCQRIKALQGVSALSRSFQLKNTGARRLFIFPLSIPISPIYSRPPPRYRRDETRRRGTGAHRFPFRELKFLPVRARSRRVFKRLSRL